jgi:hypothetical protein
MKKPIVIGLDFDGVVAYNPARIARFPISYVKEHILGVKKVSFFVPRTPLEKAVWALAHETSIVPGRGIGMLKTLVEHGDVEAHLLTARFGFLEPGLMRFLRFWELEHTFASITLNTKEEQPHEFKSRMIQAKKFAYYIEDNWDIVTHLSRTAPKTRVHWIYNILDRGKTYPHKYPFLERSLEMIMTRP